MGPYHHYCKVLSPEPIIECLCYRASDPGARLEQVEYILAKSITRTGAVSLSDWNKNWHDHKQEIATGRVAGARSAGVGEERIFRAVARTGKVWGKGISQNVVWYVVKTCCERSGLEHIAPHDLRRTCAKLCHSSGGRA